MKFRFTGLTAALALSLTVSAQAGTIRAGVVSGAYAASIEALIPGAKEAGNDLEIVDFTDWTTPNIAHDAGDIGTGILANFGLYSLKHDSLDIVPECGSAAVACDPVNQGRGVLLLEKTRLIKLRQGVSFHDGNDDIIENPNKH